MKFLSLFHTFAAEKVEFSPGNERTDESCKTPIQLDVGGTCDGVGGSEGSRGGGE